MSLRKLFLFDTPATAAAWQAIDDRVMGGVSRSRLRHDADGHAVFEGTLSLDQGGGFASVRASVHASVQASVQASVRASTEVAAASPPAAPGAAAAQAIDIEAQGDGRAYKLSLFIDAAFDAPAYQATFVPPTGRWQVMALPLAGFVPRWRGRDVADAPPLDITQLRGVGLMISERQAGPFALQLRSIRLR